MKKNGLYIIIVIIFLSSCADRYALREEVDNSAPRINNLKIIHLGGRDVEIIFEFNIARGIKKSHLNIAVFSQSTKEINIISIRDIELEKIGYSAYPDKITSGILGVTISNFVTGDFVEITCEMEIWITDSDGRDSNREKYKFNFARQMMAISNAGPELIQALFYFDFFEKLLV